MKMRQIRFLSSVLLLLFSAGCSRYDARTPDTPENRAGFARVIGISPDSNITEVYFYADETGFDPLYCLTFQSSPETVRSIVKQLKLEKRENTNWEEPFPVPHDLFWWDPEERKYSEYYFAQIKQAETIYHFWHNPETRICQFMMVCY